MFVACENNDRWMNVRQSKQRLKFQALLSWVGYGT